MPLLPPEPFVLPTDLFEQPPDTEGARWWVLHTRPRAEKSLARAAFRQNVPFFLPLHTHRWRNNGRWFSAQLPLFPGYLFFYGDEGMRTHLLETRCVANCIAVADQHRLWGDLTRVHQLMHSGMNLTPQDRLVCGSRVVITAGPLAGFEGKLVRFGREMKLVVEVEFIRRGVSAEIESWMVEPAGHTGCARLG